jgi:glycosyltransferase involved in cell wall biosynthesis
MLTQDTLRVAALVDLPRTTESGGHVKCWERLAAAAADSVLPLDLTVYFSGPSSANELGEHARIRQLPPVFSTSRLKFLSYVPDHTDLASYHRQLGRELKHYDVIHTTDGYFAFAQTAERISRSRRIPLVTSFHTDTPAYTRVFTRQTIEGLFRAMPRLKNKLIEDWNIPQRKAQGMEDKLKRHVKNCRFALVTRPEDHELAEDILGKSHVHHLRLGVDKAMFGPHRKDRAWINKSYAVPPGKTTVLFVGRVDIGKNIYTLIGAIEKLVHDGLPLHLIVAGVGPAVDDVRRRLGEHASVPGYVQPDDLARLYASVDVLALSSEVEIRSMAAVEALASGCPILVSKKSGVAGLFDHTPAMQVVDSSVENWIDALSHFVSDRQKQNIMRAAAIDYSRHRLASWHDVLAEDLFPVWQTAVTRRVLKAA